MNTAYTCASFDKTQAEEKCSRIKRLRDSLLIPPSACLERLRAMTSVYKETEGQPMPLRRALSLKRLMENIPVFIQEDEFIVGRTTGKKRGSPFMPEIRYDWYLNEIDTISTRDIDRFQPLSPAERAELETLIPYWEGKSVNESGNSTMPDGLWEKFEGIIGGGCSLNNHYFGHHSVDYTV